MKQETPGTATGEVDGVVDPEYRTRLQDALGKFRFDPGVMQRALGKPYTGLNLDVLLDTTRTLASLSRGESVELTDRDAMPNQMVLGPEDLFEERIRLDAGGLRRKYLWNATLRGNLGGLPSLPLQQQLDEVITSSGLAQPAEFINPLEVLDKMTRVTRLGQGGIGSLSAVPSEARSVQPTHFALIDPTRTPECFDSQTEVMTRDGWKRWPDVTEDDEFACLVDGKLEFHRPERIIRQRYRGTMYGADTGRVSYLVTPNHRLWVAPLHNGARFRFETAEQVHGKNRKVMSGGFQPCDGDAVEYVELAAAVHTHKQNAHQVLHRSRTNHYYTVDYDGMVYCATVPGGLLYVRRGDTVGHWSGNSERAGVDVYFASNTRKGPDRQVYTRLVDARTGQPVWKAASDLADATVAFPEMLKWRTKRVPALKGGKIRFVPRDEVDFVLPHFEKAFSTLNNLVPAKSALKGQRAAMASRMLSQALPLRQPEAPLVQVAVPDEDDVSYEEKLGERLGAIRAKAAGRVIAVTPDEIKVKQADGTTQTYELYHHYGLARKTGFHNTPLVSVGDTVQPGTLLARSNYTDDQGRVALGVNARVAYVPYLGTNFEDANVVSESFARKLTSEHYYKHSLDLDPKEYKLGKNAFVSLFPSRYDKETLSKLDEDGVVKPGTRLKEGDPIILAARPRHDSASKVHKKGAPAFHDASVTWDHHDEAEVVDVIKTKKGPFVLTRSYSPLREADKLSGRYGDKGVTAKIVPDRDMPRDKDGRPFDLLLNPHGMISRVNPAQYVEALLGKVAEKTGKPYKIRDFEDIEDLREFAEAEARKHGVSDLEDIYDPVLGRKIPGVMTGVRWIMKLYHTAECYDEQTEVLTARGWTPWPEVREDDLFATVENDQLLYERPLEIIRKPFRGELCTFSSRYIDYAVTPNHRMYVASYPATRGFGFKTADEVHGRLFRVRQFGFVPDQGAEVQYKQLGRHRIPWDDFCELVGWWASEGYTVVNSRRAYTVIYQSESANPKFVAKLERLFQRLPFKWHYYRVNGEIYGLATCDRDLAAYLHQHGSHCHNKRLPREVLDGPVSGRRRVFAAMLDGDGQRQETPTGPHWRYSTTSRGLADDFQELTIRIGLGCIVRPDRPRNSCPHCLPSWTCSVSLKRTVAKVDGYRRQSGFARKPYDGWVYCATMRTGLLYVRRNGKPMLCGNSKGQGRGTGGYTAEGVPTKGGEHGSKRVALLNVNALLSHGAYHVLRDAGVVRGQRNEPYWLAFMSGYNPPPPKVPLVYEKFLATLRASGINPVREGRRTQFMALTNKDIDELAGDRYLENAETVMLDDDLTPVKGGLFDPRLTGSHNSTRWARIKLHEPMLNPVMEEPARRVLGLTGKQLENIIAGREQLHGRTGMEAIAKALDAIDLPKEIALARQQIRSGTKTAKDAARRRLSYLKAAEDLKIHPREWVLDSVPVLPPVFRPISMMTGPRKAPIVADANLLYKELWDANENLKAMKEVVGDEVGDERLALYNAFKAVTGLGDPLNPKLQEKRVKGLLAGVFGSSPKHGVVQYKLIGSAVDHVGRGVILPNPDFDMDTLGLPEDRAWDVYKTYVIRRLRRAGMAGMDALREVEAKTPRARKALEEEMQVRPVIMDRAPVLHKFGVLAFRPKLVKGSAVQLPPLVYKGFSCVGRVPIRQGGQFRIVDLADFPHGAPVPDEPGAYEVPEDVEVLTHCSSGGFSWQHPDRYYIHPQLQGVRVTFGRNRQVTVSESHSLYCFDPEQGKCRRMTPAEALGKLSPRVVAAECGSQELGSITGPDGQPLPLTADLGWWLGVVIGDGWPSFCKGQAKGVCLAGAADSSVLRAWSELSHALFGKGPGKPHDRDEDNPEGWGACRRLTISSAELARWLEPLTGRGSRHKHLPDFIWSAPEEFQLGLLAGLLDTDGHCGEGYRGRSNVTITTKSRLLAEQLVWLLAQLGVDSACNLRTNNHGRQAWVVNPSVVAFGQLDLPMQMPSKLAELQRLREAPRNSRFVPDLVPISVQEAEELLTHFRGTAATAKGRRRDPKAFTEYSALCKSRQSGGLGRGTLAKIITRLGKDKIPAGLLARWESDERWERVTKLEPAGVMDMYDLRVPGTYTFVLVNKVTVFDSADNDGDAVQYHVPADPEAVQEAYERMLPSKSLIAPADMKTPMHAPSQEYIAGLYAASAFVNKKSSPKVFRNEEDVARAYARGEISADDRVEILQAD